MTSRRTWALGLAVVAAVLVVARIEFQRQVVVPDALAQEQRDAAPMSTGEQRLAEVQLPALIRRCRAAARARVWPDKVGRFDYGHEPEGAVMFMSRRFDGLPVVSFDTTFPMEAGFFPVTPPMRGHVGVTGRFDHVDWLTGGPSAADAYFCEIEVDGMRFDIRKVSIEVVR